MATFSSWCPNDHKVEIIILSCDVRRDGEEGVVAVMGVEDVTCHQCGKLISDLGVEE